MEILGDPTGKPRREPTGDEVTLSAPDRTEPIIELTPGARLGHTRCSACYGSPVAGTLSIGACRRGRLSDTSSAMYQALCESCVQELARVVDTFLGGGR